MIELWGPHFLRVHIEQLHMQAKKDVGDRRRAAVRVAERKLQTVVAVGVGPRAELVSLILMALLTGCVPLGTCYFTSQKVQFI